MTLLEQALKAKDEDRFEEWFFALSPEKKETLKAELALEDYMAGWVVLETQKRDGPSETK